ncbi:MAG: acyl-CoA dehydrogenase family protein [Bordetella sp.]|nr:acyl-CoA dehydrogenase family protein [Bordetella sp.]
MTGTAAKDGEAFQLEVREWLAENFPASLAGKSDVLSIIEAGGAATPESLAWRRAMGLKGWGVPTWPAQYGGGGLTHDQAKILNREMQRIGAWNPIAGMGVIMFGPTLLEVGSEEQKQRHIPPIARGELQWCQGYSEPGAGSDLAALQMRAEDKGDHFLVNGQKTWTSGGQWADWCFALVRTDASRKHEGISFLLIDMKTPGVEVRPIEMISGGSTFCETFFTDVKAPKENLVGPLNGGWAIGKRLLQHERQNLSGEGGLDLKLSLPELAREHVGVRDDGRLKDSDLRGRITRHEMESQLFTLTMERIAREARSGQGPSATSSILKNVGAAVVQERTELMQEIRGLQGLGWEGEGFTEAELADTRQWLWVKAVSIFGGSTEIQKNVIAKRILGLQDHQ